MRCPIPSKTWETFLQVPTVWDLAPVADEVWLAARGVEAFSPAVLRCLLDHVLPLVRGLERDGSLVWYSFLVHDHTSGVPTDDKYLYIHLRLSLDDDQDLVMLLPAEWKMTRRCELHDVPGIDFSAFPEESDVWHILGEQSVWLLSLLEQHTLKCDFLTVVKHVRQFLHYFANMAQMRVA